MHDKNGHKKVVMPLMPVYVGLCLLPTPGKVLQWSFYTRFFHLESKKVVAGQVRQVVVL